MRRCSRLLPALCLALLAAGAVNAQESALPPEGQGILEPDTLSQVSPLAAAMGIKAYLTGARDLAAAGDAAASMALVEEAAELSQRAEGAFEEGTEDALHRGFEMLRQGLADGAPMASLFEATMTAVDTAVGALHPSWRQVPQVTLEAMLALLREARTTYAAGVAGSTVSDPIAYHRSRGLALVARQAFDAMEDGLASKSEPAAATMAEAFDRLDAAYGAQPAPVEAVTREIAAIDLAASRFRRDLPGSG